MRQVKDVRLGDHVCLAFAHEAEQRAVAGAFVSAGLDRGERVMYFTDDPAPDGVRDWLAEAGVDVSGAVASGRLEVLTAADSYLGPGRFDPDLMIALLRTTVGDSLAAGFAGLRVTGEMSWALRELPGAERLEDYERRVTGLFAEGDSAALCQYDARRFPAHRLTGLRCCHPGEVRMDDLADGERLRVTPSYEPGGELVLRLRGTIDRNTAPAWHAVLDHAAGAGGDVWVDLSELEFIDVAGTRALARAAGRMSDGHRLRVRHASAALRKVLRLTGWDGATGLSIEGGLPPVTRP
ncbi:MEDS domain-containing protein [Actinomadura sp. ATCC 31491]|uniref:MEDS domain-containing protein n=1 Tax=Actinomadura luzonensis TaxID=2805427 RepID=A0ABT0FIU3_9ACTN|nr:MEDS domain-containing protein [Actinomadura luzonensis]MCK2212232.1 MEDS domain-containing protein [Actinomadura luzonensis]